MSNETFMHYDLGQMSLFTFVSQCCCNVKVLLNQISSRDELRRLAIFPIVSPWLYNRFCMMISVNEHVYIHTEIPFKPLINNISSKIPSSLVLVSRMSC